MFNLLKIFILGNLILILIGCAPSLKREGYNLSGINKPNSNCDILVTKDENYKGKIIGKIYLSDNGLTINCTESDVMGIIKKEGCQLGADVIVLKEIREPDILSSCYRVTGVYLKLDTTKLINDSTNSTAAIIQGYHFSDQSEKSRELNRGCLEIFEYSLMFIAAFTLSYFLYAKH